ncbi:hypothetical protein ZWY2020_045953 [Hordeum vulgare]|nr:hypothetical protein ZWY2020_045953 [Hordeum vulgare]
MSAAASFLAAPSPLARPRPRHSLRHLARAAAARPPAGPLAPPASPSPRRPLQNWRCATWRLPWGPWSSRSPPPPRLDDDLMWFDFIHLRATDLISSCFCRATLRGGGGVPTMGKQKAAMAGKPDPKNTRHALGDIGNIEANNQRAPVGDIANVVNLLAAEG